MDPIERVRPRVRPLVGPDLEAGGNAGLSGLQRNITQGTVIAKKAAMKTTPKMVPSFQ